MRQTAISDPVRAVIRRRFAFDEWRGVNRLDESLFIWQLQLAAEQFPGWRRERVERVELPGQLPALHGVWSAEDRTGAMIAVDAVECRSRGQAHDELLELLAHFQVPGVEPAPVDAGDVAFGLRNDAAVVFARANLAFSVRSVGPVLAGVTDAAQRLDTLLVERPGEPREDASAPRIARFEPVTATARAAPGRDIPLRLDASDPLQRPLWFKVFAAAGDVRLRSGGDLAYRPAARAPHRVSVFAVPVGGGPPVAGTRAELTLPPQDS